MFPRDYDSFTIIHDEPAKDTKTPRQITLQFHKSVPTCKHCESQRMKHKDTRHHRFTELTDSGERVVIDAKIPVYVCDACGKQYVADCLPSCIPAKARVSTDVSEAAVDYMIDKHCVTIQEAADKFSVSPKVVGTALRERVKQVSQQIGSLQPCVRLVVYPFLYQQITRCAIWGFDDDGKPMLYDIREEYSCKDIDLFFTEHAFQDSEDPWAVFVDIKTAIIDLFKSLYGNTSQICIIRDMVIEKCKSYQRKIQNSVDSFVTEKLRTLVNIFEDEDETPDDFENDFEGWMEDATEEVQQILKELYQEIRDCLPECKNSFAYSPSECSPEEHLKFIKTFRQNNLSFEEMRFLVFQYAQNKEGVSMRLVMQSDFPWSMQLHRYYIDLNYLNSVFYVE